MEALTNEEMQEVIGTVAKIVLTVGEKSRAEREAKEAQTRAELATDKLLTRVETIALALAQGHAVDDVKANARAIAEAAFALSDAVANVMLDRVAAAQAAMAEARTKAAEQAAPAQATAAS